MDEFLLYGGFPEIVLKKNPVVKTKTLSDYFDTVILKDVVERFAVRDVLSIKQIASFALTNVSKEYSYNSVKKTLNIALDTVKDYTRYLTQAHSYPLK